MSTNEHMSKDSALTTSASDTNDSTLKLKIQFTPRGFGMTYNCWLMRDGVPVSYVKVGDAEEDGVVDLYEIETRPGCRRMGYAKEILERVSKTLGVEITHDGGYTPDGLAAIAPLFESAETLESNPVADYSPQSLVLDWDKMIPRIG